MTDEPTLTALRERASQLDIAGRSSMKRDELERAIAEAEGADTGDAAGGTNPGTQDEPVTDAQTSTAGIVAGGQDLEPSTPEEVGRQPLLEVAQERAHAEAEGADTGDAAGGTNPGTQDEPVTDAQTSTAGIVAGGQDLEPSTPEEVGRPPLLEVAQERAQNRNPRVIGATTQED